MTQSIYRDGEELFTIEPLKPSEMKSIAQKATKGKSKKRLSGLMGWINQ